MATKMQPLYDEIQTIYDQIHSTDLMELFLDPTLLYSCAYFERGEMTLGEAQIAKLDLSLGKCDLKPRHTLLEVGCGWGACSYRAAENYDVDVIGLTLSEDQAAYCQNKMKGLPDGSGNVEIRLQGWEEFNEPINRIISIAAFEHFPHERHQDFFEKCYSLLPGDGQMMVHTIVRYDLQDLQERNIELTHENVQFAKFMWQQIFPKGDLPIPRKIVAAAKAAGFEIAKIQTLGAHYARTLDIWAENLIANRDKVIEMKSEEVFDTFMKYLTQSADHFRSGHIDLYQFTLCVPQD